MTKFVQVYPACLSYHSSNMLHWPAWVSLYFRIWVFDYLCIFVFADMPFFVYLSVFAKASCWFTHKIEFHHLLQYIHLCTEIFKMFESKQIWGVCWGQYDAPSSWNVWKVWMVDMFEVFVKALQLLYSQNRISPSLEVHTPSCWNVWKVWLFEWMKCLKCLLRPPVALLTKLDFTTSCTLTVHLLTEFWNVENLWDMQKYVMSRRQLSVCVFF